MIKISFKTQRGHYLTANDSRSNYRISATPVVVGLREVFTIIPSDGRNSNSLRSGDQIHLQTHDGRYVMARDEGGGAVSGEATLPNTWEKFTIEKLSGEGEIVQGNRVTLKTYNGRNYIMARDGGGGEVTAESSNRLEWETFAVEFWNSMAVHLRANHSQYLAAEDGGGREITATRDFADIWETFLLINLSRKSGLRDGDKVCLQVWDGRFVAAERGGGGNLTANSDYVVRGTTFTIKKARGGEISLGDSVSFLTQNGVNYVMALEGGGGIVNGSSRQAREWETFQITRVKRSIQEVYRIYSSLLGSLNGPVLLLPGGGDRGRYQLCASGIIIEDPVWGAFELHGDNYRKFLDLSAIRPGAGGFPEEQLGMLGYLRSDVRELRDHTGFYNYFERGLIISRPDPIAAAIYGDFYEAWGRAAAVGYPRLDRLPMRDGRGTYQLCDYGTIYYTPTTGAHAIYGDVWKMWKNWVKALDHDPDRNLGFRDPLRDFSVVTLDANPTLGYPISEERDAPGGRRTQYFEFGSITWRVTDTPRLRFLAQNTALLPTVAPSPSFPFWQHPYRGAERERAIRALIEHLRANQYDVVGLSECFEDGERSTIWSAVRDIYPHTPLEGPDENDVEQDGALLLMSRHPILERHQTIYRQAEGNDRYANKGVLHALIQVPGLATGYDVFLSHTQDPNANPNAVSALKKQWLHLSAFIRAYSSPERPAILLGDLNTNAFNPELFNTFRQRLNYPEDLWLTSGDGSSGITIDDHKSFSKDSPPLAVDDPQRYRNGSRVDYLLSWPGLHYAPQFRHTQVLHLQSSAGRDLSDHYGLSTEMAEMREFTVDVRRPITQIEVELMGFRCLEESDELGDDSPYFTLDLGTANERWMVQSLTTARVDNISTGEVHNYLRQVLRVADPGDYINLIIKGKEYDAGTGDDSLGRQQLQISRNELLMLWGGASSRVMPLLTGDGSGYAITVRISVS